MNTILSDPEHWKPVVGFEQQYSISSHGRVRRESGRTSGRLIATPLNKYGYPIALLSHGKMTVRTVHRLVMAAFVGPRPEGFEINHSDGNKANNHVENLEYITRSANIRHAFKHGLNTPRQGSAHGQSKLTERAVQEIRGLIGRLSLAAIGRKFGVSATTIAAIKRGTAWRHVT